MPRSAGFRFFVLGLLTVLMFIPLMLAGIVIDERSNYAREATSSVSRDMGGRQVFGGPQLVLPVEGDVTRTKRRDEIDPVIGEVRTVTFDVTERGAKDPIYLAPRQYDVSITTTSQTRKRGIFEVPVFTGTTQMLFDYDLSLAVPGETEVILWDQAFIQVSLSDNRALRGETRLIADGSEVQLTPRSQRAGIRAALGDPRDISGFDLSIGFTGAERLQVAPAGQTTNVTLTSDWPHPKFDGSFLPDASEITEDGFSAAWTIPLLARSLPAVSRSSFEDQATHAAFGVTFFQPNDFYHKAFRATAYGVLFIALTFLTVFLIEPRDRKPVHPVQYILIGLAQSIFVLLMVAYAEQIGFDLAYLVSTVATIGAIMLLAVTGMKLGQRAWVLGATLAMIYAILYLILQSTDYALLAGSTLCFAALVGTIWATRNEEWHGTGGRWFARKAPPPVPQPQ